MNTANPAVPKVAGGGNPPVGVAPPPQQPPIHPMAAAAAAAAAYQQQQQAGGQIDPETKRMQDLVDTIMLITNIRDDVTSILDNVGKTNASLHAAMLQVQQQQQQQQQHASDANNTMGDLLSETFQNFDSKDLEFLEKTDNKYLLEKVGDINKSIGELEQKLIKDIPHLQLFNFPNPDFNAVLLDQTDDKMSSHKLISNYRWWCQKIQECLSVTSLMPYKRSQQPYAERKSTKYKLYPMKQLKREELEKMAYSIVNPSGQVIPESIKTLTTQKSEHEFVIDMLMPQNFKFVMLLFDYSVERLQVRPIEHRIPKIYYTSKQRNEEIGYFDFEHKNSSNVFHRLEQNSLLACVHFKTEHGQTHIRYLLNWLKNFINLFNAKCVKCEKHLLNGLPPTWRDLKTLDPLHDECKIY